MARALKFILDKSSLKELFQQALPINRKLNEQFPEICRAEVAVSCNNMAAIIMLDLSQKREAEALYQEVLQIYKE